MARKAPRRIDPEEHEAMRRELWIYQLALHLMRNQRPDASATVRDGRERYRLDLYGPNRADGGILIRTFYYPGQTAMVTAHSFPTWERDTLTTGRTLGGVYHKFRAALSDLQHQIKQEQTHE